MYFSLKIYERLADNKLISPIIMYFYRTSACAAVDLYTSSLVRLSETFRHCGKTEKQITENKHPSAWRCQCYDCKCIIFFYFERLAVKTSRIGILP